MNIDISTNNKNIKCYKQLIDSFDISFAFLSPTRITKDRETYIDHVLIKKIHNNQIDVSFPDILISDHKTISINVNCNDLQNKKITERRIHSKLNIETF